MNTFELKDTIPQTGAGPAAPPTPALSLPAAPQPATPAINATQLPLPTSGLAAASFGGVLGEVDVLSEQEEQRRQVCEETIQAGWHSFVDVGLALAEIRDGRLYRDDFSSFEKYCESRWEFKRGKAHYQIAAARIYRQISKTAGVPQPDRESQLRPLLAVSMADAELAWQCAVQFSCGRPVTARVVKRAIHELQLPLVNVRPLPPRPRQSKRELRGIICETMDALLSLITQKAEHSALLEKFEALHSQLQLLFKPEKRKNR